MDGSVILFVRYRNHFPVVQFQNQAHIRNPHGTGQVIKTIWGVAGTPNLFFYRCRRRRIPPPQVGRAPMAPQIYIFFLFEWEGVCIFLTRSESIILTRFHTTVLWKIMEFIIFVSVFYLRFIETNRSTFVPPFERLRSSQQSVLYNSVRIWNCVPEEIKTCQSFAGFKNRYKEYLLEFYNQW